MEEPKNKAGNTSISPVVKLTTIAISSNDSLNPQVYNNVPVIAADVYSHPPAFYRAALTVMERNHRCIIEVVE